VHLLEGRFFTEGDDTQGAPVVIVDDLLARRAWPGQSPLGPHLLTDPGSSGHPKAPFTVVGVVKHLRVRSVVADLTEQVFFSQRQTFRNPLPYVVKTTGDPGAFVPAIRHAIASVDPLVPMADVRPFESYTHEATASGRFTATLAAIFAVVALVLACVGIYGVVAYGVARRSSEFAVRLVLGARPGQVVGMAIGEGARLAAFGVAAGLVSALLVARAMRSQLFGVAPSDPVTFALAATGLAVAALISCWIPARRAANATPSNALRGE
jgi:hypothetical protein